MLFEHTFTRQQDIAGIPDDLKNLYKTVWEISQKTVLKMAADRGAYIDQSQSLNIHIAEPNYGKLTSMHFYGWKLVSPSKCRLRECTGEKETLIARISFCTTGPENRYVLPADEACRQSHPVHAQQGEAEGEPVEHKRRGGGQRAQHGRDGLLSSEQRGLHDVRLLVPKCSIETGLFLTVLHPANTCVNVLGTLSSADMIKSQIFAIFIMCSAFLLNHYERLMCALYVYFYRNNSVCGNYVALMNLHILMLCHRDKWKNKIVDKYLC